MRPAWGSLQAPFYAVYAAREQSHLGLGLIRLKHFEFQPDSFFFLSFGNRMVDLVFVDLFIITRTILPDGAPKPFPTRKTG
jgi:hypothetical protein